MIVTASSVTTYYSCFLENLLKATCNLFSSIIQLCIIGCALTAGALSYGMYQMKTGNRHMSQRMMRLRILAQGFTVVALLFGVLNTANAKKHSDSTLSSARAP